MQISYLIWLPEDENMALFCRAPQKRTVLLGQNVFKIGGNMHRDLVYCMKLILKEFMQKNNAKLKNNTKMVKLSQQNPVHSY